MAFSLCGIAMLSRFDSTSTLLERTRAQESENVKTLWPAPIENTWQSNLSFQTNIPSSVGRVSQALRFQPRPIVSHARVMDSAPPPRLPPFPQPTCVCNCLPPLSYAIPSIHATATLISETNSTASSQSLLLSQSTARSPVTQSRPLSQAIFRNSDVPQKLKIYSNGLSYRLHGSAQLTSRSS
jgi:hypothetical protein